MDAQTIIDIVDKKMIPGIFLRYKIKAMVKFWRKRSKNSKQRYYKLKQWNQTEQSYLQKLIVLRDQVKKPLLQNNMIDQYQQTLIFSNLQSMIQLAEEMKTKIDSLVKNWNPISTVLAPTVQSLVIYLKIYKQYSNNFQRADKIIQQLKKNPNFSKVVKVFNVEDYLIKPVQRPLQYKLFLSDYLRLLPDKHVDKAKLAEVLKTLLKIADQINEFVEKQIRAQKMVVLQQTFGNIIQSTREYRSQFQADHPDFHCKVYVFNDLLLIVKNWGEGKEEKFMYMYLCGASYIIRPSDNVNFKNRMYICGSFQSIHLTFKSAEIANNYKDIIESLIGELYQKQYHRSELMTQVKIKKERETMNMNRHSINNNYKWKQQYEYRMKLIVQVIGVQKRLYEKQWKIVYAVKIQLGKPENIYQIIFYEIDQLKQLQAYLKEVYPGVTVPSLDTRYKGMSQDDIKNDFTKYYQFKCILIEDFINYVVRCKDLAKKPQYIMFKLKISQIFWDHLNRFSFDCICDACNNAVNLVDIRSYQSQKELIKNRKYQFCIINSFFFQNRLADIIKSSDFSKFNLEEKLLWANSKQKRIDYSFQNRARFGKKLGFHVSLALIGEQSEVYVDGATINDTCRQIVEEVCLRKYIPDSSDFCLVYVHGKHEYYLDNDEYVYDAVIHIEQGYKRIINDKKALANANRTSIFNTFSKSMDGYGEMFTDYSVADEPKLFLRKYVYLSLSLDEWACQKNPERYTILLGEILRKFQQQLLLLTMDEIKVLCGLLYGAEQFNTIIFSKKIFCNQEKIRKYLPEPKWNFVDVEFLDKVRQVIESQVKHCQSILSVYKAILKKFGDKLGTITQYFSADSLDPASLSVKQKTLLIGVNYQRVIVCRRFNSVSLLDFPLDKFKFRTSGDTLIIDTQEKTYSFIGTSWLFFQKLVEKYRLIYEMEKGKFDQEIK